MEPGVTTPQGFGWYSVGEVPLVIEAADPARGFRAFLRGVVRNVVFRDANITGFRGGTVAGVVVGGVGSWRRRYSGN